jgi:hypothetical protein
MIEVWSEPEGAVADIAMAQWEEASVVTVRGSVVNEGRPALTVTPCLLGTRFTPAFSTNTTL